MLSTGQFCLPNQKRCYRDDERGGSGTVNMVQAIEKSTNTYFYKLALDMGIDRLSEWMGRFSFGAKTGIDLLGESEAFCRRVNGRQRTISKAGFLVKRSSPVSVRATGK